MAGDRVNALDFAAALRRRLEEREKHHEDCPCVVCVTARRSDELAGDAEEAAAEKVHPI